MWQSRSGNALAFPDVDDPFGRTVHPANLLAFALAPLVLVVVLSDSTRRLIAGILAVVLTAVVVVGTTVPVILARRRARRAMAGLDVVATHAWRWDVLDPVHGLWRQGWLCRDDDVVLWTSDPADRSRADVLGAVGGTLVRRHGGWLLESVALEFPQGEARSEFVLLQEPLDVESLLDGAPGWPP